LLQQHTLKGLEFETGCSESVEHFSEPTDMSVKVGTNDDGIIEVNEQSISV